MKKWLAMAIARVGSEPDANPTWYGDMPYCSEDECPHYDGKRCELIGNRPRNGCEPVVEAMGAMLSELVGE